MLGYLSVCLSHCLCFSAQMYFCVNTRSINKELYRYVYFFQVGNIDRKSMLNLGVSLSLSVCVFVFCLSQSPWLSVIISLSLDSLLFFRDATGLSTWCHGESDGLRNRRKRLQTPVALLRSLSDKYPWERYEPPYPLSYELDSTTTVVLEGWLWHWITYKGWYAIKQRNQTR